MKRVAFSTKQDAIEAVRELANNLEVNYAKAIIYYVSPKYNCEEVASEMHRAFPDVITFGCTHVGAFALGETIEEGIVAMSLDVEDIFVDFIEPTDEGVNSYITLAEKYFGCSIRDLDISKFVGLTLLTPFNDKQEEFIMEKLGDKSDIIFVGGSAADKLTFTGTYAMLDEKARKNGNIVAIIKTKNGYVINKTQSVEPIKKGLTVTKLGDNHRIIKEIDNRPALDVYCEITGLSKEDVANKMKSYPFGLIIDGEVFVRSPQSIVNETEIALYCEIKEGTEIAILKSLKEQITEDTERVYNEIASDGQCLAFNCILRKLELQEEGQLDEFHSKLNKIPTIGFHTYGEQMVGHINQTATMLVIL